MICDRFTALCSSLSLFFAVGALSAAEQPVKIEVHWDKVIRVSKTKPTLLLGASPTLARNAPLHDRILKTVGDLGAEDVRYAGGGYVFPHFGVAELDPPTATKTSWDFSYIDPITEDVMKMNQGRPIVLNFSAIPEWMFKTPAPVPYPADPSKAAWHYEQGRELRDPDGARSCRLFCARRCLAREGRLHGRTGEMARVRTSLEGGLLGGLKRAGHRARP